MKTRFIILIVLLMALTACSSGNANTPEPSTSAKPIEVSNAAVMLPAGNAMGGMGMQLSGYMQIKNNSGTDDRLIGVSCDFADATLHETKMNGDVASMSEVSGIDVPANGTVELKSGGFHIMFMNPKQDLKVGDSVSLTLQFEKAGSVTVTTTVTEH